MVQIFELTKALKLAKYSQIIKYPLETLKVEHTFYKFMSKGGLTLTTDVLGEQHVCLNNNLKI